MPNLPKPYVLKFGDRIPRMGKEPTLPVSKLCEILRTWAWTWMQPLETDDEWQRERRREFKEHWRYLEAKLRKSNLLYRMLYIGEERRRQPCPRHQGRHGGHVFDAVLEPDGILHKLPRVCECQYEDYLTGWLPNEPDGPQQLELFEPPIRKDRSMFIVTREFLANSKPGQ